MSAPANQDFRSDNVAGAHPAILAALERANAGTASSYGEDDISRGLEARFRDLFETDCAVFPVATGTAANALALASLAPPWGAIYCHREAHIAEDECGAPEFFTGGAKLVLLDGAHAKLDAASLAAVLAGAGRGVQHRVQPAAVSISQASERGALYRPAEIAALAAAARAHGVALHMDGARFANAVAALGCAPADIAWRAGVEALSFGATKNGALAAEAVVFFRREAAEAFGYRRKRAGHLFSKMRFLSAQLAAYLDGGLWLANARHANAMARRLAEGLKAVPGAHLADPVEANEVFVALPEAVVAGLEAAGFRFHRWEGEGGGLVRLVTAFNTAPEAVDALVAAARRLAGAAAAD
jgi:threonine aldolase